jgi:beta-galactosidase/beta-glucuronidase
VLTRWGRDLDPDHPLPEHPRPQLVRQTPWVNLNGRWEYAFGTSARPRTWDGEIVVPFSPETVLSGVGRQLQPDEWLWYRRGGIRAPQGERVLLHLGAVDQSCTVWVNGVEVGGHTGGYLPFSLDVTEALVPGAQVVEVRVRDLSETGPHARGKQRLDRGRIWYTAQSGIWQTVWLEAVPEEYVASLAVVPDLATGSFTVTVTTSAGDRRTEVVTPEVPRRWSPEDPYLHELVITHGQDRVTTYAALRSFGTAPDADGHRRFLLNGEPFAHVGVLDQGYWPDGLLTPPSDAAMVHDLRTVKELGFTAVRKHVKIEPMRWYHHCDRLGLLVWQDMVNGGGRYRELVTNLPARRPVRLSDRRYRLFLREDEAAREEFRAEVRATVALLGSSPCVAVWTLFNEGWGQFDSTAIAAEVAALDPTRPVNAVSGWIDQGGGDVRSHHSYLRPFRLPARRRRRRGERRAIALTEYGGYSHPVAGHVLPAEEGGSEEFGYRHFDTPEALADGFTTLHREQVEPAVRSGLAASFYTQLTDVEDELNGLLTWDREVLKIPAAVVRAVLDRLRS